MEEPPPASNPSLVAVIGKLPSPWGARVMNDGRIYYIQDKEQTSHWIPPTSAWVSHSNLPYGTEAAVDKQGHTYYISHPSQETTRENPRQLDDSRPYELLEEPRTVKLARDSVEGFGFVAGSEKPLVVRAIIEGTPAEGLLRPGDEIIQVNGENVHNLSKDYVVDKIRKAVDIELVVKQPKLENSARKLEKIYPLNRKRRKSSEMKVRFTVSKEDSETDVEVSNHPLLPSVLRVFLENGQTKSFKYDESTSVTNVLDVLQEKLSLEAMDHFALVVQNIRGPHLHKMSFLSPTDKLCELATRPDADSIKVMLRVMFLPREAADLLLKDPEAFHYLYLQCCNDVLSEHFKGELKHETALQLAVLKIVEMSFKDTDLPVRISLRIVEAVYGLKTFLPVSVLNAVKHKELRKVIKSGLKQFLAQDALKTNKILPVQVQLDYLKLISELRTYGSRYIPATLVDVKSKRVDTMLVTNPQYGLLQVINVKNNEFCQLTTFNEINSIDVQYENDVENKININLQSMALIMYMDPEDSRDFVLLLDGYYKLLVDKEKTLLEEGMIDATSTDTTMPPYLAKHYVIADNWNYVQNEPGGNDPSDPPDNHLEDGVHLVNLSDGPPNYDESLQMSPGSKHSLTIVNGNAHRQNHLQPPSREGSESSHSRHGSIVSEGFDPPPHPPVVQKNEENTRRNMIHKKRSMEDDKDIDVIDLRCVEDSVLFSAAPQEVQTHSAPPPRLGPGPTSNHDSSSTSGYETSRENKHSPTTPDRDLSELKYRPIDTEEMVEELCDESLLQTESMIECCNSEIDMILKKISIPCPPDNDPNTQDEDKLWRNWCESNALLRLHPFDVELYNPEEKDCVDYLHDKPRKSYLVDGDEIEGCIVPPPDIPDLQRFIEKRRLLSFKHPGGKRPGLDARRKGSEGVVEVATEGQRGMLESAPRGFYDTIDAEDDEDELSEAESDQVQELRIENEHRVHAKAYYMDFDYDDPEAPATTPSSHDDDDDVVVRKTPKRAPMHKQKSLDLPQTQRQYHRQASLAPTYHRNEDLRHPAERNPDIIEEDDSPVEQTRVKSTPHLHHSPEHKSPLRKSKTEDHTQSSRGLKKSYPRQASLAPNLTPYPLPIRDDELPHNNRSDSDNERHPVYGQSLDTDDPPPHRGKLYRRREPGFNESNRSDEPGYGSPAESDHSSPFSETGEHLRHSPYGGYSENEEHQGQVLERQPRHIKQKHVSVLSDDDLHDSAQADDDLHDPRRSEDDVPDPWRSDDEPPRYHLDLRFNPRSSGDEPPMSEDDVQCAARPRGDLHSVRRSDTRRSDDDVPSRSDDEMMVTGGILPRQPTLDEFNYAIIVDSEDGPIELQEAKRQAPLESAAPHRPTMARVHPRVAHSGETPQDHSPYPESHDTVECDSLNSDEEAVVSGSERSGHVTRHRHHRPRVVFAPETDDPREEKVDKSKSPPVEHPLTKTISNSDPCLYENREPSLSQKLDREAMKVLENPRDVMELKPGADLACKNILHKDPRANDKLKLPVRGLNGARLYVYDPKGSEVSSQDAEGLLYFHPAVDDLLEEFESQHRGRDKESMGDHMDPVILELEDAMDDITTCQNKLTSHQFKICKAAILSLTRAFINECQTIIQNSHDQPTVSKSIELSLDILVKIFILFRTLLTTLKTQSLASELCHRLKDVFAAFHILVTTVKQQMALGTFDNKTVPEHATEVNDNLSSFKISVDVLNEKMHTTQLNIHKL